MFPNAQCILPYLERPKEGPTSLFCAELAVRLRCYVAAGYPERLAADEMEEAKVVDGVEVVSLGRVDNS